MNIVSCGKKEVEKIYFVWHLTNWCNFKCSYCTVLDSITNDFTKPSHTAMHNLSLRRLANVEKLFNICLSGGEPTIHPNILEILDTLQNIENCEDISMFTNFSRPLAWFQKLSAFRHDKLTLFASYHPEYVNNKFYEKCVALKESNYCRFSVHVSLHDNKKYWDNTLQFMDKIKSLGINCKPLLLQKTKNYTPNYTQEFYDLFVPYLESSGENGEEYFKTIPCTLEDGTTIELKDYELEVRGLNKFKGYSCTPVSYKIEMDGNISTSCTNRVVPILLKNENLIVKEICTLEECPSRRLLSFHKERV